MLGVSWDGTGYGPDGTVWGGEFLRVDGAAWDRRAHLAHLPPAGRRAGGPRSPARAALGLLYELFGDAGLFDRPELAPI